MLNKFPPIQPKNKIYGTDQQDTLVGTAAADAIYGGGSKDVLFSGAGADDLYGGEGNDLYIIQDSDDHAYESAGEGLDAVDSYVSYTLGANIEYLALMGTQNINGTGNELENHINGNDGNNILWGRAGEDLLWGGKGADTMVGGTDNDTFFVDNIGDVIVEFAGEGTLDHVITSVNYSLVGTDVEGMSLAIGAGAIDGTGNDLDNVLSGNESENVLKGGGGEDYMSGHGGKDTMYGGEDSDYYVVDSNDDVVVEFANEGIFDRIEARCDYTMSDNVEGMSLAGANAINGWGNGQDNVIHGGEADNSIYGLGGNDTIHGAVGYDKITGGVGDDTMYGDSGKDTFLFFAGFGHDTLGDFRANGDDDVISFDHNLFADFNAVQSHMTQNGNDVVITLDADNSITIENMNAGQLTTLQFSFF